MPLWLPTRSNNPRSLGWTAAFSSTAPRSTSSKSADADRQAALTAVDEMQHAAELLDRVDEGELEGYLVELIDRARTARPIGR